MVPTKERRDPDSIGGRSLFFHPIPASVQCTSSAKKKHKTQI